MVHLFQHTILIQLNKKYFVNILIMNHIPSIDALHREKSIKENKEMSVFTIVLNKCIEKIIYTNRHTAKTFVLFEVPQILIGYPAYDKKLCIMFLIQKLSEQGYLVSFIEPFYLHIDWCSPNERVHAYPKRTNMLTEQTQSLLKRFPNTSKVEFVFEDTLNKKKKKKR